MQQKCNETIFVASVLEPIYNKTKIERGLRMERESKTLEYKEQITRTFLKTVSAYANYGSGKIVFGISDDGIILGLDNPEQLCLNIENMINDNLSPIPDYSLEICRNQTIVLTVFEGLYKPYLYRSKAYKRNDSATIEVNRLDLNRLVLDGMNQTFEEQISNEQNLTFQTLETTLVQELKIEGLSNDILKTLQLMTPDGRYTNAGALIADHNQFKGVDIIRFGTTISELRDRKTLENCSILTQFFEALNIYRQYYQIEKIEGAVRRKIDLIPEEAFREALANALVHRLWDVDSNIKISMFEDKIEISSPGSLPPGISKEEYLNGQISTLRNPIIGNLFYRLNYIEKFGTGIKRINEAYSHNLTKPNYQVYENSITVGLPTLNKELNLNEDEKQILNVFDGKRILTRAQIDELTGFNKAKTVRILNHLTEQSVIQKTGKGRDIKYTLLQK